MTHAYICDAQRTPFGRYGGGLAGVRADDLGAVPIRALMARNPDVDWTAVTDVLYGCANQAGEDNRNVARMAALLAGLPDSVPGATLNRLCGSGLDAIGSAARFIKSGEAGLLIAGGVESMSRAPFVMGKADSAFSRGMKMEDTTIGWRFINPLMKAQYGVDSMPETAENVAADFGISRADQDAFALASQVKALAAQQAGVFDSEICPVSIAQKKGEPIVVSRDEHPRATTLDTLAKLKPVVRADGTITAGNASGVNDGAAALLLADEANAARFGLTPRARVVAMATAGVAPRIMGIGPAPATLKVLAMTGLTPGRLRRHRTERSVCRARPGRAAPAGLARRRPARQPERRRDCPRPSAGRLGCTAGHDGRQPAAPHGRALCAVHHVHRRGAGHCAGAGTGLILRAHRRKKVAGSTY